MKAKVVEDADVVTYVVVGDPGDEAVSALAQFARSERLEAAGNHGCRRVRRATVGWFDREAKEYLMGQHAAAIVSRGGCSRR